jgi:6-phosphofructokinase 1
MDRDFGNMIGIVNGKVERIPLAESAGKLKTIDPDCQEIQEAKRMGISFGD